MQKPLFWLLAAIMPIAASPSRAASCSKEGPRPFYCFKERAWHQWDVQKVDRSYINSGSEFMDQCVVPPLADWVLAEEGGSEWKAKRPKDWDYKKDYSKAEVQNLFLVAASWAALDAREKSLSYAKWQEDWMKQCVYPVSAYHENTTYANRNTAPRTQSVQTTPDVIRSMLKEFFLAGKGASDELTRKAIVAASVMPQDRAAADFAASLEKIMTGEPAPSPMTMAAAVKALGAIRPDLATDKLLTPLLKKGKEQDPAVMTAVCEVLGAIIKKTVRAGAPAAKDLKALETHIPDIQDVGRDAPENSALKTACYQAFTSYPREIRCKYMKCLDSAPPAAPATPAAQPEKR